MAEGLNGKDLFTQLKDDFGVLNKYNLGPTYLLPDGSCLRIPEPEEMGVGALVSSKCHALVNMWIVYKKYVKGYTIWDMNIMHVMEDKGAVRINFGDLPSVDARLNYIVLPKTKLTPAQADELKKILDDVYVKGVKTVEVNLPYPSSRYATYNMDKTFSEDIINNIKNYYTTGSMPMSDKE